jgi:hypothetical protein
MNSNSDQNAMNENLAGSAAEAALHAPEPPVQPNEGTQRSVQNSPPQNGSNPSKLSDFMRYDFDTLSTYTRQNVDSPWRIFEPPSLGRSFPQPRSLNFGEPAAAASASSNNSPVDKIATELEEEKNEDENPLKKQKLEAADTQRTQRVKLTTPFYESTSNWNDFEKAFRDVVGSYGLTEYLDVARSAPFNFRDRIVPRKGDVGVKYDASITTTLTKTQLVELENLLQLMGLIRQSFTKVPKSHPANILIEQIQSGNPFAAWKHLKLLFTETSLDFKRKRVAAYDLMEQKKGESIATFAARIETETVQLIQMEGISSITNRTFDGEGMTRIFLRGLLHESSNLRASMMSLYYGKGETITDTFETIVAAAKDRAVRANLANSQDEHYGELQSPRNQPFAGLVASQAPPRRRVVKRKESSNYKFDVTKARCNKCHVMGHTQRECSAEPAAGVKYCTKCTRYGHDIAGCLAGMKGKRQHYKKSQQ